MTALLPVISCPAGFSVVADSGLCGARIEFTITSSDYCPSSYSQTDSSGLGSGDIFPVGTTQLSFRATDASGNSSDCGFSVTVRDSTPPRAICPANIAVATDSGQCGAVVQFTVTSDDYCPSGTSQTDSTGLSSGSLFPVGTTRLSFRATDASGNSSGCGFSVTVRDSSPPVISCPPGISVATDSGQCGAVVQFTVTSDDYCPSGTSQTDSTGLSSGSLFPVGTTQLSFRATDASGNSSDCAFGVTVRDSTPPTITCPANINVAADSGQCGAVVQFTITSDDFCPSSNGQTDSTGLSSGSFFPVGTTRLSFRATDASGNTADCFFTVHVSDTTAPQIVCPANIVVPNDSGVCGAQVDFTITSSDYCPAIVSQSDSTGLESGDVFPVGTTTLRFVAGDASGNSSACSFTVQVRDTEKPVITIAQSSIQLCQFSAWADPGYTASDNCGDLTAQVQISGSVNVNAPGTYLLHYDVSDAAGNAAIRQTRQITILPSPQLSVVPASVCPGSQFNIAAQVRDYSFQAILLEFYANGALVGRSPTRFGQARYPSYQTINSDTSFLVVGIGPNGCTDSAWIIVTIRSCASVLAANVLLEGPYDPASSRMTDGLRSNNLVPATEPYSAMGYQFVGGGGETVSSSVLGTTGTNAIVDWIVVELRDSADPRTISYSRAALLQADGDVVDTDGLSSLQLDSLPTGSYYLAIWHRNHLGVMTAQPVYFNGSNVSIDFSDPNLLTYGSVSGRRMVNGDALLYGGDADHNGQIQNTDNVMEWIPSAGSAGYKPADFNLDGQVQNSDLIYFWLRNAGRGSAVPR
ncbi:MAG: DUF5011 domain-containing protein [Bacteroidia bacterium]